MELLNNYKQNGYFTAELYHLLVQKKLVDASEPIIPSVYQKEMKMSTQERLQNLNNIFVDNLIVKPQKSKQPVLLFTPKILLIQNFRPNDRIVAKFSVKNISKAPTFINMVNKESSYFYIKPCGGQLLSRLAPGIGVTFSITFTPVQYEDYTHKVSFYTETDQYVMPIIAMGPRPIFDFPDTVTIPDIPLKVQNETIITVHNIGMIPAGFTLCTRSPFSVKPKSAYLDTNEKIDITVCLQTMSLGDVTGLLYAVCETGESFQIKTFGKTFTVSIEVEKQVVRFLDTYNTMVRQQTYKIVNKSDHLLTYMCMKNDCIYFDFEDKVKLAKILYNLKESEAGKDRKLVQYDIMGSDEHERVYTRIFFDEIQSLVADETLQFQNTHFSITPIKGNLWPRKAIELTITFSPKEIGDFSAIAFLDIDGVQDRLPLKMVGTSLPPNIQLNVETLDMDCVYINNTYNYEIVAINNGHINGVIVYNEVPTLFGSRISCSPEMHCLRPGQKETFVVSFCNSNQGPYFEEINFSIRDTKVVLKLNLKGEVIYPTVVFNVPCLNFGMVSVGVPEERILEVTNESTVEVCGSVKISSDGPEISSIILTDYALCECPKPSIPQWPREFKVEPPRILIQPFSRILLKVILTANLIRTNQTSLNLELEKTDSPPISLPVMYNAMVPEITIAPELKLRACFKDFLYKNEIQVSANDFYGYFTIEDSEPDSTIEVEVITKEGLIEPNSTITLPVTIKFNVLGVQEHVVRMNLFGKSKPLEICRITGCGVRPIVTCVPTALHWGQVKLLTTSKKTLTVINDSPVSVNYTVSLLSRDGRWRVEPSEGQIEPESELDLILILYLIDADTYTNKAIVHLENIKDILVPLSATGVGTSIVVGEFRDRIMVGRKFTKMKLNHKVIIENHGTRLHSLEWNQYFKAPKSKIIPPPFYNLEPKIFKMTPGEKLELTVTGMSPKAAIIQESWYLVGSIEGVNKKELLMECKIVAEFVDAKIEISSPVVEFQYDFGPYSEYYKLTDIITIKNVSMLPLSINLIIKPPFAIIKKHSTYKVKSAEQNLCCCIYYDECDINIKNIIKEVGFNRSKVFIDCLTLKPVEPFRQEPLHFFEDIKKIKMAFNLTHSVEEMLEDQEVMKLQILFDTTKHTTLKSKVYTDLMRIRFKGHKNKDAINLIGTINHPNIIVLTPRIDFKCIVNGSVESKTIQIQNLTPLMVCYKLNWKKSCITTIPVVELSTRKLSVLLEELPVSIEESHTEEVVANGVEVNTDLEIAQTDKIVFTDNEMTPEEGFDSLSLNDSEAEYEIQKQKLMKTIAPMLDIESETEFTWTCKFERIPRPYKIDINEIFTVAPHRGLLKPKEMQFIHVIFRPTRNINIKAILECEVLGGPPEIVTVSGQSSDLMYKLNSNKLNFKIRSFHEHASEKLIITNIASVAFEYKTYLNEPVFENELEGTILDLLPPHKVLESDEEVHLNIVMRTGVVGFFQRVFLLEIGHLPHIPIEVFGWGVVPQVYLTLPRPQMTSMDPEFGYTAIQTLTIEYLAVINEIFTKETTEHLNSPNLEICFDDPIFSDGWHICSPLDGYPTIMDIDLAMERMLVINYIKQNPDILAVYSTTSKTGPIPGFQTAPYIIDFGVVITGYTVQYSADIINYGPIPTKVHFSKGTDLPPWLSIKLCGKLNPGETGKMDIEFAPTSDNFTELEQDVEFPMNLEMAYGVVMPIKLKALCAVPFLASNVTEINFGSVRCGDKVISSIPLKNVGKPTCVWFVSLILKAPGPNPITILDSAGKYAPGEGGWLSLAFKPTMEMTYEGVLIFRFHMNPKKITIPIIGQGIAPQVHVIGPNIVFPPTLPWADTTDIYFGLTNPCPFPIEIIIAHIDKKWKEEEEIFQLLHKYYNKPEEMLVPAIKPGEDLPVEIINFYRMFKESVQKTIEEEVAAAKAVSVRASITLKKLKSPKGGGKPKDILTPAIEVSPCKFRSEAEIIADEIKALKENNMDPLKESQHVNDETSSKASSKEKPSKGLIAIFHGSPGEEMLSQEMAYSLGMALGIPTINFDLSIVEALCTCETNVKDLLLTAINEGYMNARKYENKNDDGDKENVDDDDFHETDDEFSIIQQKLKYLLMNKNVGTPRSKTSDKKKKPNASMTSHTAMKVMGSTTMFQIDLIQGLLTDHFNKPKFNRGFILDSLTSSLGSTPAQVLMATLRSKPSIRNIHLVLCQSDYNKWVQAFEEAQKERDVVDENIPKEYDESEIEDIITTVEEMDEEEYENASPEMKSIYIKYGLEQRRQKHNQKYDISIISVDETKKERASVKEKPGTAASDAESKKKVKKEETKAGKPPNEYVIMNSRYNEYTKVTYESLLNIANNWIIEDGDLGYPLVGIHGQLGAVQKKAKKKSDILLQMSDENLTDKGFPLSLVMYPCIIYKEGIVKMFQDAPIIRQALKEDVEVDILEQSAENKEYTVLIPKEFPTIQYVEPLQWYFLDELPIMKCQCNQLTDIGLVDDTTQDNVINILSKWHCVCGKKVVSSQTSTSEIPSGMIEKVINEYESSEEFYPQPFPLRQVASTTMTTPEGRILLQPGDLVRCKFSFNPREEGNFKLKRFVEVSGWPESRVDVFVSGICDLPRLDSRPKKMFKHFSRRTIEDYVYKTTYLDDQKVFEFGPIFIGPNRLYEEQYTIDLKNASLMTADILIEFLDDTTVFQIDKTEMILEPGTKAKLTISAAPTECDVHTAVILFCVKHNPEIVAINIRCSGVVPVVEILPTTKSIDYGRQLLYRREDDRFIVKNDSILPIMWKIQNESDFIEDFIITTTTGIVPRHDNQVVPATYIACQVGVITNKELIIEIYDEQGRGDPLIVERLFLSAECYDVLVECVHENPDENFLNYGNVKVNSRVYREMYLYNRGKYNIYYKFKKVKNFPEPSLLKSFIVTPECGVIFPTQKVTTIDFECMPTTSLHLVNVPAFSCSLLDDSKEQVVVAKFPVCVTIASFYNTFTLFPLGELNFNVIAVGSGVKRDVILNNTSKCPVTYEIILPKKYQIDPNTLPQQTPKAKDNKNLKVPPLRCGNFVIMNEDNLLAPGMSRKIEIQFSATEAKKFEETIKFIISDTCPAEAQGIPLKLIGTGALPTIDFWNVETTFREHLIVKTLDEYRMPEASPHCVFVENSATLHFFCVNVNTRHTAYLDLYNNGLVPCALTIKLIYQSNSGPAIFSLDKYETHIEPLLHKNVGIIFSPKALKDYRAILHIHLKLLDNKEETFTICLIGEGVLPRIHLIKPPIRKNRMALLNFPVTCLGSISNMEIRFKNITSVLTVVTLELLHTSPEERPVFWMNVSDNCEHMLMYGSQGSENARLQIKVAPDAVSSIIVYYNPINRGKTSCDIKMTIYENPYEYFNVLCEAEAFMEDVVLIGLEMLSMDLDVDEYKSCAGEGTSSLLTSSESRKKIRSAPQTTDKKKVPGPAKKKKSVTSIRQSDLAMTSVTNSQLKYLLDFGGCELCALQKRSVIMANNSEKVYKFSWVMHEYVVIKPANGYISPGEEKDVEILFFASQPVNFKNELFSCNLTAISDDLLTMAFKGSTWDSRQVITLFDRNRDAGLNERIEAPLDEQVNSPEECLGSITIIVLYSAITQYTKYHCTLTDKINLLDTFIYQTRSFDFKVVNTGSVPMKITWSFHIDEEYPSRIDEDVKTHRTEEGLNGTEVEETQQPPVENNENKEGSRLTLFSEASTRQSVDTWFEINLPFSIEPSKDCLKPNESTTFTVTFAPLEVFNFNVRLRSFIDNLDPYDQNICCRISAKSLIPYVHFAIPESDYLTSGRRKDTEIPLPPHIIVLEFNVLGWGCYKKTFDIINPTCDGYEFMFEMMLSEKQEVVPVHCNMLKGYIDGGTSTPVTFTFAPTAPGVYESRWKFTIPQYKLSLNFLVVGLVREPEVVFVPSLLLIRNSLVGFTTTNTVILKNLENATLNFEFKGNSICNEESGKVPVVVEPEAGVMKPLSMTPISIIYTPFNDGPLTFKIFFKITFLTKYLPLCVNALSYSIKPKVTYHLIGHEHFLNSEVITNIYLDQTASTYERTIPFTIKNDGSATFFFDWNYVQSAVKKYLVVNVEPRRGHVTPGNEERCILSFTLKQVPVQAFPVNLYISDGPEYTIYLHSEIKKPAYCFSCQDIDFGMCFINAPDTTYKKTIAFNNEDKVPVIIDLNFKEIPDLYVDFQPGPFIPAGGRLKIPIYFRPKHNREYEFKLQFWVNSLCEEFVTVKGEGVALLFDLYEGCQRNFNLGPVRVGSKIVRTIEVMNHSKIPIVASFIFRYMYPTLHDNNSDTTSVCLNPSTTSFQRESKPDKQNPYPQPGPSRALMLQHYKDDIVKERIESDSANALSSLKVTPSKCIIKPYHKAALKIHFKPVGMISSLDVQLNMEVLSFEKPLVKLIGSATGMHLYFNQNSLEFGRVRIRGLKILKVMLINKGDFGARFWWQPLKCGQFNISPMQGHIAAHANLTFTITFRPLHHNPFIKVWASCNIENYKPLELSMYGTCIEVDKIQNKILNLDCPVRGVQTQYVAVTNPTDDMWLLLSEVSEGPFDTLKEFDVEPKSTFEIPIHFRPLTMGRHEGVILYSPLGDSALFVNVVGIAGHPNPNREIEISVPAKEKHTESLTVYNLTEFPETYVVSTEVVKTLPDKFNGHYEIKSPDEVKTWGEAKATCSWTFVCYEECEMHLKVVFINELTKEYQYYFFIVTVTPSQIVDTFVFKSRAREIAQRECTILNPLKTEAEFFIKCDKLSAVASIKIPPASENTVLLSYSPLVVGSSEDYLEIYNNLAGTLMYKVILECLPAKEKDMFITTPLGTSIPLRIRVHNKSEFRTEFIATISHPSIQTEKDYILDAHEKGKFLVWFEPIILGVQHCRLSFNSPDAGEFVYNIKGIGAEPKPQGPYELRPGDFTTVTFKNVFEDDRTFKINVDKDEFFVKVNLETIKSKQEVKIVVYMSEMTENGWEIMPTGTLTIECFEPPMPKTHWTYFLQGVL